MYRCTCNCLRITLLSAMTPKPFFKKKTSSIFPLRQRRNHYYPAILPVHQPTVSAVLLCTRQLERQDLAASTLDPDSACAICVRSSNTCLRLRGGRESHVHDMSCNISHLPIVIRYQSTSLPPIHSQSTPLPPTHSQSTSLPSIHSQSTSLPPTHSQSTPLPSEILGIKRGSGMSCWRTCCLLRMKTSLADGVG